MKKIFNVIGICALMSYLFIFPSCKESYDEEELLSDIEKKKIELEKEKTFVFAGDTFQLPARIKKIDSTYVYGIIDSSYTYSFNASDREAIKQQLFELTSKISEYGNFELHRENIYMWVTPLNEALTEVSSDDATDWYFVGSNGMLYNISFDSDSEIPNFSIGKRIYTLNEDNTLYIPLPPLTHPIVVFD